MVITRTDRRECVFLELLTECGWERTDEFDDIQNAQLHFSEIIAQGYIGSARLTNINNKIIDFRQGTE